MGFSTYTWMPRCMARSAGKACCCWFVAMITASMPSPIFANSSWYDGNAGIFS